MNGFEPSNASVNRQEILSMDTGFDRNYQGEAYASYLSSESVMFPVPQMRSELPDKSWVVGVVIDGRAKAYPLLELPSDGAVEDRVGGVRIVVRYDEKSRHHRIPSVLAFWFAWQAFYPDTGIWNR